MEWNHLIHVVYIVQSLQSPDHANTKYVRMIIGLNSSQFKFKKTKNQSDPNIKASLQKKHTMHNQLHLASVIFNALWYHAHLFLQDWYWILESNRRLPHNTEVYANPWNVVVDYVKFFSQSCHSLLSLASAEGAYIISHALTIDVFFNLPKCFFFKKRLDLANNG